jgi:hypothetical protein
MALFNECMHSCAHIVLDTADIVRDGDFSPTTILLFPSHLKTLNAETDDSGELLATIDVAVQKAPKTSPTTATIAVLGSLSSPGIIMQATKEVTSLRVSDKGGHRVWAAPSQP